ncbi:MAG: heavy metal translocating P-type ATPase [Candidatus Hydrogenedentes bacterium]|nr:heavy metal translocating P-type ATPase [Candidatus Hydrogenedentota bacterium]
MTEHATGDTTGTPSAFRQLFGSERFRTTGTAVMALICIAAYAVMRLATEASSSVVNAPLILCLIVGGVPQVIDLFKKFLRGEFGSDLLGGISITTSVFLGEYLAGAIIVLMLSGGEALEAYALRSASSVLAALAKRMPSIAHRRGPDGIADAALESLEPGDIVVVYPHEICPVDGDVIEGRGVMDESYLTGEPFQITKTIGSSVISGSINGEVALTIRATQRAADSRYARIMSVMRESEATRPQMRRLGDQLGAVYTPIAVAVALLAWGFSGDATRFLAVLVIATPCPLLIGIPVAIIGSISLCARRAIIVKSPVVLEQIAKCRTAIFDKTGTLTYGEPALVEQIVAPGFDAPTVLALAAGLERYSKHPLASAILKAAEKLGGEDIDATEVSEHPGQGLRGRVSGQEVLITSRKKLANIAVTGQEHMPGAGEGLECVVAVGGAFAAVYRFRDAPRSDSHSFMKHLGPRHQFNRLMIVSGDRESEVHYLAKEVGITDIHAQKSPEEKLAIVRDETKRARTLYVGDGINDAPAMMAATVGLAIGQGSDVTAEAAGVVVMDNSLRKIDEFLHISKRMRSIALQTAVGGMVLSLAGMAFASVGMLSPVEGAICQEVIDVLAVLNALRAAWPPRTMSDM